MKILFDYGTGGEEWSPPTFKQCAAEDIHNAFLNPDEHGEVRTIRYDGVEYQDITVIESGPKEGKRLLSRGCCAGNRMQREPSSSRK